MEINNHEEYTRALDKVEQIYDNNGPWDDYDGLIKAIEVYEDTLH